MAITHLQRGCKGFLLGLFLVAFSLSGCLGGGVSFDLRPYKIIQALDDAPRVISVLPGKGATGVSVNPTIRARFSRDMDGSTITGATFTLEDEFGPVTGSVSYDAPTRTATFTLVPPAALLYLTEYTATISPLVRDGEGNYLARQVQWGFTTMAMGTPTHTVTFDSMGGSTVPSQTVEAGHTVSKPLNPVLDDHAFEGWYTSNTFSPVTKWDFDNDTVAGDMTLYAHFLPGTSGLGYTLVGGTHYTVNAGSVTAGSVVIPDTHAGIPVTEIQPYGFQNLSGLTSVWIPDSVTIIRNQAFLNCIGIGDLSIGNGVATIETGAFSQCSGIATLTIGEGVVTIGASAFSHCTGLTSVTIPDSVTNIGDNAFQYCANLSALTIGSSVQTIGNFAFWYCDALTSVTIPASVHTIGASVLRECPNLTTVYALPTTPPAAGTAMFTGSPVTAIYVPSGSVSLYQGATNWSAYAPVIMPLP